MTELCQLTGVISITLFKMKQGINQLALLNSIHVNRTEVITGATIKNDGNICSFISRINLYIRLAQLCIKITISGRQCLQASFDIFIFSMMENITSI